MGLTEFEAGLRPVGEDERDQAERGRDLADRMDRQGLSAHALHRLSGKSRDAIKAAREGVASDTTYRVLEQAVEDWEAERERGSAPIGIASEADVDTGQFIEVTIKGHHVTATVKAPIEYPEELQRALSAILHEIKGDAE